VRCRYALVASLTVGFAFSSLDAISWEELSAWLPFSALCACRAGAHATLGRLS
jgi:hypothetical protein